MAKRPMRENASGPMPSMGLGVVVQAASVNASMAIKARAATPTRRASGA